MTPSVGAVIARPARRRDARAGSMDGFLRDDREAPPAPCPRYSLNAGPAGQRLRPAGSCAARAADGAAPAATRFLIPRACLQMGRLEEGEQAASSGLPPMAWTDQVRVECSPKQSRASRASRVAGSGCEVQPERRKEAAAPVAAAFFPDLPVPREGPHQLTHMVMNVKMENQLSHPPSVISGAFCSSSQRKLRSL